MKTKVKTPNFNRMIARTIEEIRNVTCIDGVDAEVIEKILQGALREECRMLDGYYEEEYYNAIDNAIYNARNSAYDAGYAVGYDGNSDV